MRVVWEGKGEERVLRKRGGGMGVKETRERERKAVEKEGKEREETRSWRELNRSGEENKIIWRCGKWGKGERERLRGG